MKKIIAIALIFATSLACVRKGTSFTKSINNTSTKTIHFYFYGSFNPMTYGDTVTVNPGELKEIHYYKEENSDVGVQQPCNIYDDSIRVEVVGGGTLNKDLTNEVDWSFETGTEDSQNCTFEITDADIL
jgi:hypothetical protein